MRVLTCVNRVVGCSLATTTIAALIVSVNVAAATIQEIPLPGAHRGPVGIVAGPDGNIWFTEYEASNIGVVLPDGTIIEHPTYTPNIRPTYITVGPDGNLWFTATNRIGRMTTSGGSNEFTLHGGCSTVGSITGGPDTSVWFPESCIDGDYIVEMSTGTSAGSIKEYSVAKGSEIGGIVSGNDGNLRFAEYNRNAIGKLTLSPVNYIESLTPTTGSGVRWLTSGSRNDFWLPEANVHKLAHVAATGAISEFDWPDSSDEIVGIVTGADRRLWIADSGIATIWQVDLSGTAPVFVPYPLSSTTDLASLAIGLDGSVWFSDETSNRLGVLRVDGIFRDGFND